jgi:hypothetical protein
MGLIFFMNVPDVLMGTDREASVKKAIKHCQTNCAGNGKKGLNSVKDHVMIPIIFHSSNPHALNYTDLNYNRIIICFLAFNEDGTLTAILYNQG